MYVKDINSKTGMAKSKYYKDWIKNFPDYKLPKLNKNKKYEIYLKIKCKPRFDIDNGLKSLLDQITRVTGVDDVNYLHLDIYRDPTAKDFNDGNMFIYFKEVV